MMHFQLAGILEGVKPLLNGLFLSISDEVVLIGDRYYVKATATITDGENSHTAIRDSFDKVAKRVPAFKEILNEWDSLVALLKSEMKTYGNKAPETYRRISELRKD
ncbi:hypothetical protein BvCmsSINP027_00597 [Escherichia coli]|uniref:ERF family protein n=1 Tax=Escherichia coli TaxID=562 RepID=UPI0010F3F8CE|nr:ERF family protein [Escherichia coli]GDS49324.1 hypothetical protein BvCmsSINP027_00597 [Escherichia coli]